MNSDEDQRIGAFETMYVHEGRCVLIEEHMRRLSDTLERLNIKNRVSIDAIMEKISDGSLDGKVLRVAVTEDDIVFTKREFEYTIEDYNKGSRLCYSHLLRNESSPSIYMKILQRKESMLEKQKAKESGFDEIIFLNSKRQICEGATCNIFFCKGDEITTPPISCGILPGIIRDHVMKHNIVHESILFPDDVGGFDSCFITNSVFGIMHVRSIEEVTFKKGHIAEKISSDYWEAVRNGL